MRHRLADGEVGDAGFGHHHAVVEIDLADALELARPSSTPSASGSAPPDSEVPEPRGTTLMPCSKQYFRTFETCSVVSGSTTTIGCRYAIRPSDS